MNQSILRTAIMFLALGTELLCAADIDDSGCYAWQENAGWCDFYVDGTNGASANRTFLAGYVWCENVGWLFLGDGPTNGTSYTQKSGDTGVNSDGEGNLSGYGWGENIGWLLFDTLAAGGSRVTYSSSGALAGHAWCENIGWLSMGPQVTQAVTFADADTDGICNLCETQTGIFGNEYDTGTNPYMADTDGDRLEDGDELPAGTDPNEAASCLRLCSVRASGIGALVEWQTVFWHRYSVQSRDSLSEGSWSNISPAPIWELDEIPEGTEQFLDISAKPCSIYRIFLEP